MDDEESFDDPLFREGVAPTRSVTIDETEAGSRGISVVSYGEYDDGLHSAYLTVREFMLGNPDGEPYGRIECSFGSDEARTLALVLGGERLLAIVAAATELQALVEAKDAEAVVAGIATLKRWCRPFYALMERTPELAPPSMLAPFRIPY